MADNSKRYALIFALLLAGLIISDVFIFRSLLTGENSRETVVIQRVIDGDTVKLSDGRSVRLLNINAPEKSMPNSNVSTAFLKKFENSTVEIESTGIDRYERTLARIYAPDYLNLDLVRLGLASKFLVQSSELSEFSEAETNAITNNLGIWIKSNFSGCLSISVDKLKENVALKNKCPGINFGGWMLKDESRKVYYFGNISFEKINLHSSKGEDNSTDLFWGSETNIWNDDRDSAYLFDSQEGIAGYETYGY